MKAIEISKYLDTKYPHSNTIEEDFIGLQINSNKNIEKILVVLDVTLENVKHAIANNVDMIISHHPLFFGEKDYLISKNKILKIKYEILKENNVAYYSLHTNLDFHYDGLSIWQAEHIGIKSIKPLTQHNEGAYGGMKIRKDMLIKLLKKKFDISNINAYFNKNSFNKISIASGSSGYLLNEAIAKKCDVFITGEVKWHEWVFAKENGMSIIEIGHFTEKIFIDKLKNILKSQAKTIISFDVNNIYNNY